MVNAFRWTVRAALLESANHIQKIFKGQIGMQSADHVEFRGAGADAFLGALPDFIERESVSAGGIGIASESAKFAMRDANICRIDVAIDVEIADVAVARFADVVGEPADGEKVGRAIESDAVGGGEALAGQNFVGDGLQTRVGDLEFGNVAQLTCETPTPPRPRKERTTH